MKTLKVEAAIDGYTGKRIKGSALGHVQPFELSTMRTEAALRVKQGLPPRFKCEECHGHLSPMAPIYDQARNVLRRPHWKHFGPRACECPLDSEKSLTEDQVRAIIFAGRQEGEEHQALRLLLLELAVADPETDQSPGSFKTNHYDRPEEGTGCYPDVLFVHGGQTIVLEVQLAPVSLYTIATRRSHYDKQGACLIWVTRNFDPERLRRIHLWDVAADMGGALYSVDDEVVDLIRRDGQFRLRQFSFIGGVWNNEIVLLEDIRRSQSRPRKSDPRAWADWFKREWRSAGDIEAWLEREELTRKLLGHCQLEEPREGPYSRVNKYAGVIELLIAIESGEAPASYNQNVKHMVNNRVKADFRGQLANFYEYAISALRPDFLQIATVKKALSDARKSAADENLEQFAQNSDWAKIWKALWPDIPLRSR